MTFVVGAYAAASANAMYAIGQCQPNPFFLVSALPFGHGQLYTPYQNGSGWHLRNSAVVDDMFQQPGLTIFSAEVQFEMSNAALNPSVAISKWRLSVWASPAAASASPNLKTGAIQSIDLTATSGNYTEIFGSGSNFRAFDCFWPNITGTVPLPPGQFYVTISAEMPIFFGDVDILIADSTGSYGGPYGNNWFAVNPLNGFGQGTLIAGSGFWNAAYNVQVQ